MLLFRGIAVPVIGSLVLAGGLLASCPAWAQTSPPPVVAEQVRQVRSDFAAGGIRRLSANWNDCIDQARVSQDANAAERCVVYGYAAVLLGDANGAVARTPWMRHLTPDIVAPGQLEMLEIMGIPAGPQQAWLDRYRRWVSEDYTPDVSGTDAGAADSAAPSGGTSSPRIGAGRGDRRGDPGGETDLARAADGKYPREALRQPELADALRRLIGPAMFAHLNDFRYGNPMESTGRYTVGLACEPRACGRSEVRYVFAPEAVWIGVIDNGRMRIYGNPSRPARALLLRARGQSVWRGPVEDVTWPPAIQAAAEPLASGKPPRLTISPRLLPVSTDPVPRDPPDTGATEIRLRDHGGTLMVPVLINNILTVPFTIDSGASDVSVSAEVFQKLVEAGTVSRADFRGKQVYHLADGSAVSSDTFRIHVLKVGDREVRDVLGSVTNDSEGMLLGQSFLTRFRSWSIDNQRQVLLLH